MRTLLETASLNANCFKKNPAYFLPVLQANLGLCSRVNIIQFPGQEGHGMAGLHFGKS